MVTTTQRGQRGEALAADYLRQQGYGILQQNFRGKRGELDIIAEDDGVLCFVEVRTRESADHGDPLETVDRNKQRRLIKTAQAYLAGLDATPAEIRFDVLGIVYQPSPRYALIRGAFEADGGF